MLMPVALTAALSAAASLAGSEQNPEADIDDPAENHNLQDGIRYVRAVHDEPPGRAAQNCGDNDHADEPRERVSNLLEGRQKQCREYRDYAAPKGA